jgi:hypothetical protein
MQDVNWGEWMGGWKDATSGMEGKRTDRMAAEFGAETMQKLKDLNIFVIGLRGVGVETAKNLILSNVGGIVVWDPEATRMADLGTNFYLNDQHLGVSRTEACLPQLKSLNPFCSVEAYTGELTDEFLLSQDVNGTGKPFAAVVVTRLLPKATLFRLNEIARANNIAFLMAITNGVTSSLFSDFGPSHTISDATGEPIEGKALSHIEVFVKPASVKVDGIEDGETIVTLTTDSIHEFDDGDVVMLHDMQGGMKELNGKSFEVRRFYAVMYKPDNEETNNISKLKLSSADFASMLEVSQYNIRLAQFCDFPCSSPLSRNTNYSPAQKQQLPSRVRSSRQRPCQIHKQMSQSQRQEPPRAQTGGRARCIPVLRVRWPNQDGSTPAEALLHLAREIPL